MTDKILTFEEYTMNDDFSSKHRIDEMATISRPTDNIPRKSKVIVYGENDEQGTKTPHFHVQIDNGEIELEIKFEHIWIFGEPRITIPKVGMVLPMLEIES